MGRPTVVVVDDQDEFRATVRQVVEAAGGRVTAEASDPATATVVLGDGDRPDLVVIDVHLGDRSGIELTRALLAMDPALRIVLVSAVPPGDLPSDIVDAGAIDVLDKARLDPAVIRALATGGED